MNTITQKNKRGNALKYQIQPIVFILFTIIWVVAIHSDTYGQDSLMLHSYKFTWGYKASVDELSTNVYSLSSLSFNAMNSAISHSTNRYVNNALTRALNLGVQSSIGTWVFVTLPHELSHYIRGKEGNIGDISVHLEPKFMGGYYSLSTSPSLNTAEERLMITTAGMEFSTQLAYRHQREMYSGSPTPPYAFIFLLSAKYVDGYNYYLRTKGFRNDPAKWLSAKREQYAYTGVSPLKFDPIGYTITLAEKYDYYPWLPADEAWPYEPDDPSRYLNAFTEDQFDRIRKAQLLALADPALVSSLYASVKYILNGTEQQRAWMLKFADNRLALMPGIRANLGLWGAENYFDVHGRYVSIPFRVYYRQGGNMHETVRGAGIAIDKIHLAHALNSSWEVDYWSIRNGFHISSEIDYRMNDLHLYVKAGYKTHGSLIGKTYQQGAYALLGVGFDIYR